MTAAPDVPFRVVEEDDCGHDSSVGAVRRSLGHVALDDIGSRPVLEHRGFVVIGEADGDVDARESILGLG